MSSKSAVGAKPADKADWEENGGWNAAALKNALHRCANARGAPGRGRCGRIAWAGDIGTLSLPDDDLNPGRRDSDASAFDKNAEDSVTRTRKETGPPHRNQSKRTMDL
jgi:hypothetical protein